MTHNGKTTSYECDQEGNLTKVTTPDAVEIDYTYFNDGRLMEVVYHSSEATPTISYEYDEAGRLQTINYPWGVASFTKTDDSPGWNENGQLECLRYLKGGDHFHRFECSYDDSGNRVQFIDTPEDTGEQVTWDYNYDWLNRLASVARNSITTTIYAYDESDNRIELQLPEEDEVWTSTFDIADQILNRSVSISSGSPSLVEEFDHDDDGNMIARVQAGTTTHYDWDANNRLRRIRKDEAPTQKYSYDSGGIRTSQRDGAKPKSLFSTSAGVSLCDTRPTGPVTFIQGHQLLGLENEQNELYFFISDGLGSVRVVVDESGNSVGEFKHDEFGRQEASTVSAGLSAHSYVGSLGVRNDTATSGLLYMQQRYYDPQLGRFLSQDPIGFAGGLNLFGYTNQNPINNVDPSGLDVEVWIRSTTDMNPDSLDFGHAWIKVHGTGYDQSFGAYPGAGLKTEFPDGAECERRSGNSPKFMKVTEFKTNPADDKAMIKGVRDLIKKQKPGGLDYWNTDLNKGAVNTCASTVGSLVRHFVKGQDQVKHEDASKFPTLFQPNNLYNHYHPEANMPHKLYQNQGGWPVPLPL